MSTPSATKGIHPKVVSSTVAGSLTIVLVWAIQQFGHVTVPAEISSAITTLISALTGYLTPSSS